MQKRHNYHCKLMKKLRNKVFCNGEGEDRNGVGIISEHLDKVLDIYINFLNDDVSYVLLKKGCDENVTEDFNINVTVNRNKSIII